MSLNEKQIRFCKEYLIDANATQAAIRAGYSASTAKQIGSRLLTNVDVKNYIKELQEKADNKLEITRERVLAEYSKIGFSDIRKIFNKNGTLKAIHELDADTAAAIASIEVYHIKGIKTTSIKLLDKTKALDSLCKVLGYNAAEKVETSVQGSVMLIPFGEYMKLAENENEIK